MMKFLGRLLSLLTALVLVTIPLAHADETIDYTKTLVDYQIPESVIASSVDEFYGIWKIQYMPYEDVVFDYELLTGSKDYLLIYPNYGVGIIMGSLGSFTYSGIVDGALLVTDGTDELQFSLNADETLSFSASGVNVYCTRVSPDLEELSFTSLLRNPENYVSHFSQFTGVVIDVTGSRTAANSYYQIRLAVDGNYDHIMFVEFVNAPDYNLLAGDNITVSVFLGGEYSYETVLGNQLTVPLGFAFECILNE